MNQLPIPDFGELLAEHLGQVPAEALPYMLSQLERTAADRYRGWAEDVPEHAAGLLACAGREDDIADRVEAMFPPADEHRQLVAGLMPAAKATYYEVFAGYTALEQMQIQEDAERQGANAWQGLKDAYPDKAAQLDELSAIELRSADYLDTLLN
ncbi:MAG: hypothetical protein ABJ308_01510 [Halieaceae bacterium]